MNIKFRYDVSNVSPKLVSDMDTALRFAKEFCAGLTHLDHLDPEVNTHWVGGFFSTEDSDLLCDRQSNNTVWDFYFLPTQDEEPKFHVATIEITEEGL